MKTCIDCRIKLTEKIKVFINQNFVAKNVGTKWIRVLKIEE